MMNVEIECLRVSEKKETYTYVAINRINYLTCVWQREKLCQRICNQERLLPKKCKNCCILQDIQYWMQRMQPIVAVEQSLIFWFQKVFVHQLSGNTGWTQWYLQLWGYTDATVSQSFLCLKHPACVYVLSNDSVPSKTHIICIPW